MTTDTHPLAPTDAELHVGDSAFESWYSAYSPAHKGDKQRARDAYVAGMGDPLVTAAPAAVAGPSVTDAMALAFHSALSDGAIGSDEVEETKAGLRAALAAAPTPPTQAAAPARAIGPCVICGSDEPFTGTCGGGDSRALCKQPAPQADSQPAADEDIAMNRTRELAESGRWPSDWVEAYRRGYSDRAARAPADSVLEDAARLEFEMQHGSAIDAARKQGANHD